MSFLEILNVYFRGEKLEAWFFILPTGLLMVAMGAALLSTNRAAFDWGLAVPAIIFGLVLAATGIGVGARTSSQVQALETSYQADASVMVKDELPRMQKVMKNFRTTLIVFGATAVVGLLLIFALRMEWAVGLGVALLLVAAVGLAVDGIAERRGHPYVAALNEIATTRGGADSDTP
jgi:hypothetical protein